MLPHGQIVTYIITFKILRGNHCFNVFQMRTQRLIKVTFSTIVDLIGSTVIILQVKSA